MAITRIGYETLGTTATSIDLDVPAGTVDGDVLVLFYARQNGDYLTQPSGYSVEQQIDERDLSAELSYKVASSEPSSYTIANGAGSQIVFYLVTYRYVDQSSPIDSSYGANSEGNPQLFTNFLPTVDNCAVPAFIGNAAGVAATPILDTKTDLDDFTVVDDNSDGPGTAASALFMEEIQTTATNIDGETTLDPVGPDTPLFAAALAPDIGVVEGTITGQTVLSGSAEAVYHSVGTITGQTDMAAEGGPSVGEITGQTVMDGDPITHYEVVGTITGQTVMEAEGGPSVGEITGQSVLSAASIAQYNSVGTITGQTTMAAVGVEGWSTVGTITGQTVMAGDVANEGTITGQTVMDGDGVTEEAVVGTITGATAMAADVANEGTITGQTVMDGDGVTLYDGVGTITGQTVMAGEGVRLRVGVGTITGNTDVFGVFVEEIDVEGTIIGQSVLAGVGTFIDHSRGIGTIEGATEMSAVGKFIGGKRGFGVRLGRGGVSRSQFGRIGTGRGN